jgi:DNA polymerase elongation subunit (family B)
MATLVFDIETIGESWEDLDAVTQKMLTRWVHHSSLSEKQKETEIETIKNGLGFSPLTGEIVAIGMLDYEKNKSAVYFQAPEAGLTNFEEDGVVYKPMTEQAMLEGFWRVAEQYDQFVSFNGRGFDVPFLNVRSAVHKLRPSKDLMSNRYLGSQKFGAKHFDLQDLLSFYGSVQKRPSLHLACRAFGITSPKEEGVDGDDVTRLFAEKKFVDIAKYNVRDIMATKDLYRVWEKYVKM